MGELHEEINRIRRQVIAELAELPLHPWRPTLTRRQRAAQLARRSLLKAWRESQRLVRVRT
jgi:hypothetical protein